MSVFVCVYVCVCSRGGALRYYSGAAENDDEGSTALRVVDVAPVGGRLVLFPSRDLLHEVRDLVEDWRVALRSKGVFLCMC
jgi:Rps23 Pro-64 3,4-dihydroxylase Tpa1-like proline 4-hydroxylase